MSTGQYIIVAGSIGVGKTSVVQLLTERSDEWVTFVEERDVFLERFYADPQQYAFLNQLAYSLQYLDHAVRIARADAVVVQERSIYDTHCVFSRMRVDEGSITEEEFGLLDRIYRVADSLVRPSLLVLLEAAVDVAYERMVRRGVQEEASVEKEYLAKLEKEYSRWFDMFDLCMKARIRTDDKPAEEVASLVVSMANGLIPCDR